MQTSVLNKQGNFGIKILWRYTDMAIFVLRCLFGLTLYKEGTMFQ